MTWSEKKTVPNHCKIVEVCKFRIVVTGEKPVFCNILSTFKRKGWKIRNFWKWTPMKIDLVGLWTWKRKNSSRRLVLSLEQSRFFTFPASLKFRDISSIRVHFLCFSPVMSEFSFCRERERKILGKEKRKAKKKEKKLKTNARAHLSFNFPLSFC